MKKNKKYEPHCPMIELSGWEILLGCIFGCAFWFFTIHFIISVTAEPNTSSNLFEAILEETATNHNYSKFQYDCTDYSRDLTRNLRMNGWNARPVIVMPNCSSELFNCSRFELHQIVKVERVFIEPITGMVISPKNYKAYGIKDR